MHMDSRNVLVALVAAAFIFSFFTFQSTNQPMPLSGAAIRVNAITPPSQNQAREQSLVPADSIIRCSSTDLLVIERAGNVKPNYVSLNAASKKEILPGVFKLSFPSDKAKKALEVLAANPGVEAVERDCEVSPSFFPNDPYYQSQTNLRQMHFDYAWNYSIGSAYVRVSNPDTGVTMSHPDLINIVIPELAYNVYDGTNNVADTNGHGTSTAGVMAAETNNGIGVASGAWATHSKIGLIPIKVTNDPAGYAYFSVIAAAVRYAADNDAKVVSVSYQIGGSYSIAAAGDYLNSKGGLLFGAAGNSGNNPGFPNFNNTQIVSAVQSNDVIYSWSSFGQQVDFSAPGCSWTTTLGGYGSRCGTSFASPLAASVATFLFSAFPNATPSQVLNAMKDGAVDLGTEGYDIYYGYGRVDALGAVQAMAGGNETIPPSVSFAYPTNGSVINAPIVVQVQANDSSGIQKVEFYVDNSLQGTDLSPDENGYYTFAWDPASVTAGQHEFEAKAFDNFNNSNSDFVSVIVPNDIIPPYVKISPSIAAAMLTCPTLVRVRATDASGISRVELYVDDALYGTAYTGSNNFYSFEWNVAQYANGRHSLKAKAFDTYNNSNSDEQFQYTHAQALPSIAITSPANGSKIRGKITVTTTASANTLRASFYINNTLKFTDYAKPFSYSFSSSPYRGQTIEIAAKAFNCNNASATSTVTVMVT